MNGGNPRATFSVWQCVATFSLWQQCVVYLQQRLSPPHQECRHEMSAGEPNKKVESFKTRLTSNQSILKIQIHRNYIKSMAKNGKKIS